MSATTPAAPAPASGLHVRAGNSMSRTREGLLDGALSVVERYGLDKLTMSAVATRSGVAKATLYNHFRTKDEVLRAVVLREVELIADDADAAVAHARAAGADLVAATAAGLARAAGTAAEHVAARRVALEDPGSLEPLLRSSDAAGWVSARERLASLLGIPTDDPLVRLTAGWLVGQVFDPADAPAQAVVATALARSAAQSRRGLRDPVAALEDALTRPAASADAGDAEGPAPG